MVLTRRADSAEELATNVSGWMETFLKRYEDVFRSPSLHETGASTLGDLTPECIPIIPGFTPFHKPPFRLSQKEKAEIENKVKDLLEKQWMDQSSSAYGALVLFVPKPDGSLRVHGLPRSK